LRQRAIGLRDHVDRLAAKAVTPDDRDAPTLKGMEAIVDRDFRSVLMGSMLLV
jgi:hypothetical protein